MSLGIFLVSQPITEMGKLSPEAVWAVLIRLINILSVGTDSQAFLLPFEMLTVFR